jgi:HEAT repeat protein
MSENLDRYISQLQSPNASIVAAAAEAITHLGTSAQLVAVELVRACGTNDDTSRAWIAAALEEFGPPHESQLDDLIGLAESPNNDISFWAITLLGRAGEAATAAVAVLTKQMRQSQNLPTRERAAWALGKIGPPAASAIPALHEAASSGLPRLARLADSAIAAISG